MGTNKYALGADQVKPIATGLGGGIDIAVSKDANGEGPIPSAWRATLKNIVDAFARHDYLLAAGMPGVAPVSEDTATQIRDYIDDYGETLVRLPPQSWDTSVCIWTGEHWDALIDL